MRLSASVVHGIAAGALLPVYSANPASAGVYLTVKRTRRTCARMGGLGVVSAGRPIHTRSLSWYFALLDFGRTFMCHGLKPHRQARSIGSMMNADTARIVVGHEETA